MLNSEKQGSACMRKAKSVEHFDVYHEPGRYGGWPANYGMWAWGDEIVVVFTEGTFWNNPHSHKRTKNEPFVTMQGRSIDGARTWTIEPFNAPTPKNRGISADEHMQPHLQIGNPYDGENPPVPFTGGIDFTDPETSVIVAKTTCKKQPAEIHSWFHVSTDRCRTWSGPHQFVGLDESIKITGRTDIVPLGPDRALFMLTAHKSDGGEGRVFCAETRDGGRTFAFKSWLRQTEPEGFEIMSSSVKCGDGRIITAVRTQLPDKSGAMKLYETSDEGASWRCCDPIRPTMGEFRSNPPAMVRLAAGRICVVYGYRNDPYSMRGKISDDEGRTWSDEIVLRDDGGDFDVGYPRAVVRADGKVVTGYYFNTHTDGDRFIAATVWDAAAE